MPDEPTFEQLLAWVLEADDEEETFAEWLARQAMEKPDASI